METETVGEQRARLIAEIECLREEVDYPALMLQWGAQELEELEASLCGREPRIVYLEFDEFSEVAIRYGSQPERSVG